MGLVEHLDLAGELGADNLEIIPRGVIAMVSAVRGQADEAEEHAEQALAIATTNGVRVRASFADHALALVELGAGRWAESASRLEALQEMGALDPTARLAVPDLIEALVRTGDTAKARAALANVESWAGDATVSTRARIAACRGLVEVGAEASDHFDQAAELAADAAPFDAARIHLLVGEHLRRERRRLEHVDRGMRGELGGAQSRGGKQAGQIQKV